MAFGKLEPVAIRDGWPRENTGFTQWLSEQQNLSALGDELGIPLELVEIESGVGSFRLDILAKRIGTEESVVIENQFGQTDHSHLGQLLTYASGVGSDGTGARTIVWVAEQFREPHRAALDWLNKTTEPGIGFFGVEIQLWRIGNSAYAPKFNIVSRPNNWQKQLTNDTSSLSATDELYFEFWSAFISFCEAQNTTIRFPNPYPQSWISTSIGRGGFHVNFTTSKQKGGFGCELYIDPLEGKMAFAQLLNQQSIISSRLGSTPEFQELPGKKASRIAEYHPGDVCDREQWPVIHQWLKSRGEAYVSVFAPLVKNLRLE